MGLMVPSGRKLNEVSNSQSRPSRSRALRHVAKERAITQLRGNGSTESRSRRPRYLQSDAPSPWKRQGWRQDGKEMNFIEQDSVWYDESGNYRITYRDSFCGVKLPPAYYACVKTVNSEGREAWSFVGRRGPYKSRKKAEQESQRHKTYWERAIRRAKCKREVIRELEKKSRVKGHRILLSTPVWVKNTVEEKLLTRLEKAL
jgi:hypothetical protein